LRLRNGKSKVVVLVAVVAATPSGVLQPNHANKPKPFQCPLFGGLRLTPAKSLSEVFTPKCSFCQNQANELKVWPEVPDVDAVPEQQKLRAYYINIARCLVGAVSNCGGTGGLIFGSDKLRQIYKTATPQFQESWSKDITTGRRWSGYSWCGVYATAMLRFAGQSCSALKPVPKWCDKRIDQVHWIMGKGVQNMGPQVPVVRGNVSPKCANNIAPMQMGDIVVFTGQLQHHSIVWEVTAEHVITIDGNQMCQGIFPRKRPRCDIQGYYSLSQLGQPFTWKHGCTSPVQGQLKCTKSGAAAPTGASPKPGGVAPKPGASAKGAAPKSAAPTTTAGKVDKIFKAK